MSKTVRLVCVYACLLLFSSLEVAAQYKSLDLTNTVWKLTGADSSFLLTFTQGKAEQKGLVAIVKGWGNEPLELKGEFLENKSESQLRLSGLYKGQKITFTLKLYPGDAEQKPYLYGEFSTGSDVFSVSALCENQCPNIDEGNQSAVASSAPLSRSAVRDLVGEWEDTSEEIGFKEYWSIKLNNGRWQVSGKFTKDDEVVGQFQADEVDFDSKKGVLSFRQVFNPKPDESWVDSNDIEATAEGDTLKFTVRGVTATLTRAPESK